MAKTTKNASSKKTTISSSNAVSESATVKDSFDIYGKFNADFMSALESPEKWRQLWKGMDFGIGVSSGSEYRFRLLNQLTINFDGVWGTLKYWGSLGENCHVRKGEKATPIYGFYTKRLFRKEVDENGEEKSVPYYVKRMKYYAEFRMEQIENLPEKFVQKYNQIVNENAERVADADEVIKKYLELSKVKFNDEHSGSAYYMPSTHSVVVPNIRQFETETAYYQTVFHELSHSTGAKRLLNRIDKHASFGSESYSFEELVAELSSALCLRYLGMETESIFKNDVAYVASWLKNGLKNDKKLIVKALEKAEDAFRLICFGEKPSWMDEENAKEEIE